MCLGRGVRKASLDYIANIGAFSSNQHAGDAADNAEIYIKKKRLSFPKSCDSPLRSSYRTELDTAP